VIDVMEASRCDADGGVLERETARTGGRGAWPLFIKGSAAQVRTGLI
jgi:hypothetical protein